MWLWNRLVGDDTLMRKLRAFSVKYAKISDDDMKRTRKLVKDYIEDQIMVYCRQNSFLPILKLEFTGSVYERLKTEAADEVDVMVVLKTTKPWFWGDPEVMKEETHIPGYVRLKATMDSKLRKYVSPEGYIIRERLRNGWFYSLVVQAVRNFKERSPGSDFDLIVRAHGPAVQLDVFNKGAWEKLLSADLVPCFQIGSNDDYFVPKQYTGYELLWRQSFSLQEKQLLKCMDKDDHGCRHELLRIVKTIVNRERTSLGRLRSYHLKTAFMYYIKEKPSNWDGGNSLGEHFVGFLAALQAFLEKGSLPHFWLPSVNLLDDINHVVVGQMAYRLKTILNSEAVRNEILE